MWPPPRPPRRPPSPRRPAPRRRPRSPRTSSGPLPARPFPGWGKPRAAAPQPCSGARRPPPLRATAPSAAPPPPHPLAAHALRLTYGDTYTALDGVGLTVEPGRVTALVGANGAGKSTLFHCLCGTLRPDSGRVELNGVDITRTPPHTRTRLGIARTFQELAVFPSLTVEENVALGAEQGHVRHDPTAVEAVLRLLDLAGPVRHCPAAALPTGTLRRVELGRALAGRPHTLLLDEPAAGLDTAEAERLARVMAALAADGMAVLVVEHDLDLVADIAHTVHTMTAGRIAP
nr:ATP-binding cassette domain-containing protein [Streptomyces agglomeratus]